MQTYIFYDNLLYKLQDDNTIEILEIIQKLYIYQIVGKLLKKKMNFIIILKNIILF